MNWLNYSVSQQTYSPKTFSDVSTNKFNKIHERLFEDAKHKAIIKSKIDNDNYIFERKYDLENNTSYNCIYLDKDNNEVDKNNAYAFIDLDDYKISEYVPNNRNHYLLPSYLIITTRKIYKEKFSPNIKKFTVDLDEWWENEYELSKIFDGSALLTNKLDDWYPYNDIIYYDYIKGKATLENKVEMKTRKVNFNHISVDDEIKIDYKI